jgi:hypothetical protein
MDSQVFVQIKNKCQKKKVISLCNKLSKKCSFKSGADTESLCHLAYWLYIYGEKEFAVRCIKLTYDVPFDMNYRVWDFIHAMWGLGMRLLREQGKEAKAQKIADTMNAHFLIPNNIFTSESMPAREERRRSRFTYEDATCKDKISLYLESGKQNDANQWRFVALLGMIGNTETGFYPLLNESKQQIEEKIAEYIEELRKVK